VARDPVKAAEWYRKAAEQGFASAQNNLGLMYVAGSGVSQSAMQAFQWFRKAAEQGPADAQFNLAMAYFNGAGGEVDFVEAFKWFAIAASHSTGVTLQQYANSRDAIATRLTPAEVADAQKRAQDWLDAFARRPQ